MTIQDWGAIGEMIGAIAVVLSLVYLSVQIRQNTRQLQHSIDGGRLSAYERSAEQSIQIREKLVFNPEVSDLFLRGSQDFASLRGLDRFRFDQLMRIVFSAYQTAYIRQLTLGSDPLGFEGGGRQIEGMLRSPGIRSWLEQSERDWRPEFRQFVTDRLQTVDAES